MSATKSSSVETAFERLADALDALEARAGERLEDLDAGAEALDAARRQARLAQNAAREATDDLAAAVAELRDILHGPKPARDPTPAPRADRPTDLPGENGQATAQEDAAEKENRRSENG